MHPIESELIAGVRRSEAMRTGAADRSGAEPPTAARFRARVGRLLIALGRRLEAAPRRRVAVAGC